MTCRARTRSLGWLLLAVAAAGCASTPAGSPSPATAHPATGALATGQAGAPPAGVPAGRFPAALLWQRTSAEHRAIHLQVFREAGEALERLATGRAPRTWAVSLDVDETMIDNSLYAVERVRGGSAYELATWAEWVERRAATPLPGAVAFLEKVHALGGVIAVITNRGELQCEDTRENLRTQAIPFDVVLCRPDGMNGEKEPRWQALAAGTASPDLPPLEIVLWVGDNIGDFPDLDQSARDADESRFDLFGERYFILPNPVYGSWERNPER